MHLLGWPCTRREIIFISLCSCSPMSSSSTTKAGHGRRAVGGRQLVVKRRGELGSLCQCLLLPSPVGQWPLPRLALEDRGPTRGSVQGGRPVNASYEMVLNPLLVVYSALWEFQQFPFSFHYFFSCSHPVLCP